MERQGKELMVKARNEWKCKARQGMEKQGMAWVYFKARVYFKA
jgi:hypothetical protein